MSPMYHLVVLVISGMVYNLVCVTHFGILPSLVTYTIYVNGHVLPMLSSPFIHSSVFQPSTASLATIPPYYMPVSRRAVLCDSVWRASGRASTQVSAQ